MILLSSNSEHSSIYCMNTRFGLVPVANRKLSIEPAQEGSGRELFLRPALRVGVGTVAHVRRVLNPEACAVRTACTTMQVFLSRSRLASPAAIPGRFSSSSLPPLFAQGRYAADFLGTGTAVRGARFALRATPGWHR